MSNFDDDFPRRYSPPPHHNSGSGGGEHYSFPVNSPLPHSFNFPPHTPSPAQFHSSLTRSPLPHIGHSQGRPAPHHSSFSRGPVEHPIPERSTSGYQPTFTGSHSPRLSPSTDLDRPPASGPTGFAPQTPVPPPQPPVDPARTQELVVPSRFVDGVIANHGLEKDSASALRGHAMVGSFGQELGQADMGTRLETYGLLLSIREELRDIKEIVKDIPELKTKVESVEARVAKAPLALDGTVKTALRNKVQEILFDVKRTQFDSVKKELMASLKSNPTLAKYLGVDKLVKVEPTRLKLQQHIGRQATWMRNQMKGEFVKSVLSATFSPLDNFTELMVGKYLHVTPASLGPEHKYRIAVIRHYLVQNPDLLRIDKESDEAENDESGDEDGENEMPKDGAKKKGSGEKFWVQVGKYLQNQIKKHGDDFAGDRWKLTIEEILAHEADGYKSLRSGQRAPLRDQRRQQAPPGGGNLIHLLNGGR
ncbi:hypothetical protein VNI00_007620 [Paramarasmius palmivorus]|uniref:Uncharacterized protein n=1 Tax=Paramarasmius palmivorus TaxID=297713 RepID=A0AAW0CZP9_9AGAR